MDVQYSSMDLGVCVVGPKKERKGPGLAGIVLPTDQPVAAAPPVPLDDKCTMILNGQSYTVRAQDLERLKELGRGAYGVVETMRHRESELVMAVKVR